MSVTVELTLVSGLIVIVLGGLFCVFIIRLMMYILQFLFGLFVGSGHKHEERQDNDTKDQQHEQITENGKKDSAMEKKKS